MNRTHGNLAFGTTLRRVVLFAALGLVPTAADWPDNACDSFRVPSLARVEWEHIHRVLAECDGNVSQAARLLNMHRRSLQRRLQKPPLEG